MTTEQLEPFNKKQTLAKQDLMYIYTEFEPAYDWVNVNTRHIRYILSYYKSQMVNIEYNLLISVNGEVKYISSEIDSIVNYFIENKKEYENNVYKIIRIKFVFDNQ